MSERLTPGQPAPPFRLQPVFGLPVEVGPAGPLSVLLFLRSLGSPSTRQTLVDMQAKHQDFDGIQVIQFTTSPLPQAQDFVPRTHLLMPLVLDPDHRIYNMYGVERDRGFFRTLLDLPGLAQLPGRLALGVGAHQPPYDQLPAAFVVDDAGRLRYCWYGRSLWDLPSPQRLLEAAGQR